MKLESLFLVYISIAHIGWSKSINLFKLYNNLTNETINATTEVANATNTTQTKTTILWSSKNTPTIELNSLKSTTTIITTNVSNITATTTTNNNSSLNTTAANMTTRVKPSLPQFSKIVVMPKATSKLPQFLLSSLNQTSNETDTLMTINMTTNQMVSSNLVYRPKEFDELIDYEIETLEAMRHIERNASSKSVLNLFKLMDNDRDGKLSFEEIVKFLNYEYE